MRAVIDRAYRLSFDKFPSIKRQIPSGFAFRNSSGSEDSGKFCQASGRANRRMASVPTEVVRESVVAGYGPPCCIDGHTSTPVGKPLIINRPTFLSNIDKSSAYS